VKGVKATRRMNPNMKSHLLLFVSLMSILLSVQPARAAKPVVNVSVQAVGPIGGWVGGIIYSDGSARGGGSICGIDFTGDGIPDTMRIVVVSGSWDPATGVLTMSGFLVDPKTGFTIPVTEVISGLSEGHNDLILFGSRHIVQIHTIP